MNLNEIRETMKEKESFFKSSCFFHGTNLKTFVLFLKTPEMKIYRVYMDDFLNEICTSGCDVKNLLINKLEKIGEILIEEDIFNIDNFIWQEV